MDYSIVETAYRQYHLALVHYVGARVGDDMLAEDLVQDAFLRVLEMNVGVREESVRGLLFMACRHLVFDHLRRRLMAQRAARSCSMDWAMSEETTAQEVNVHEMVEQEWRIVGSMPNKRAQVYCLSRYEGKRIDEIAERLKMSARTVEAHLFAGRKEVREKMRVFVS